MNAHKFINDFGIEKANRIIESVVYDADYYSEKTGSYYSSYKNGCVKIKDLKTAIIEYKSLIDVKNSYLTRLNHWNISANKD